MPRPPVPIEQVCLTFDSVAMGDGQPDEGGGPLGGDLELANRFGVEVDDPAVPCLVHLTVGAREGRLVAEQVIVKMRPKGLPVAPNVLRMLKLDAYLAAVRGDLIAHHGGGLVWSKRVGERTLTRTLVAPEAWGGFGDDRKRRPPEALLPVVARLYREALASPDPSVAWAPTEHVAERLGYSRGHAARLVAQARRAGHLGKASPGRPGERTKARRRT